MNTTWAELYSAARPEATIPGSPAASSFRCTAAAMSASATTSSSFASRSCGIDSWCAKQVGDFQLYSGLLYAHRLLNAHSSIGGHTVSESMAPHLELDGAGAQL